jgi:hypothetical protein
MTDTKDSVRAVALAAVVVVGMIGVGAVVAGQEAGDGGTDAANQTDGTNATAQPTNQTDDTNVTTRSQSSAFVSVLHASPDAPAVDVYVDDELVLEDVSFGDASDYLEVESGDRLIRITAADDPGTIVFEATVTLAPRSVNTFAASGLLQGSGAPFGVVALEDDAFAPGENRTAVRVAHLSPDAPAVDVTVAETGGLLADDIDFRNTTDYVNVPAGEYTLEIRNATPTDDGQVLAFVNVSLEGDTAVTAVATGLVAPDQGEVGFDVIPVQDATTTLAFPEADVSPAPNATETPTPTEGNVTETPTEVPVEGNATETPTEGNATETPTDGNATETPTEAPSEGTDTPTEDPAEGTDTPTEAPADGTDTPTEDDAPTETPTETEGTV